MIFKKYFFIIEIPVFLDWTNRRAALLLPGEKSTNRKQEKAVLVTDASKRDMFFEKMLRP